MMDVVGIGSALFDILMTAEGFPAEDTKMQGKETKLQCGGPCATGLVAMSKLGVSACYMGTLGDDMYGQYVVDGFQKYGVSTDHIRYIPGKQSFHSFVLLNLTNASRTCVWNKGTVTAAFLMILSMFSFGTFAAFALAIQSFKRELAFGSGPPP